ncbi:hypothetical protein GCM10027344_35670 [Spelaeicoccus albus]
MVPVPAHPAIKTAASSAGAEYTSRRLTLSLNSLLANKEITGDVSSLYRTSNGEQLQSDAHPGKQLI